jgi:hypothetical protein
LNSYESVSFPNITLLNTANYYFATVVRQLRETDRRFKSRSGL